MLANFGAEQILRTLLRQQGITLPTSTRIHLHTGNPGSAGTANRVNTAVWTNYAFAVVNTDRATAPFWDTPAATAGYWESKNQAEVSCGTVVMAVTTDVVTATHYSITDHLDNVIDVGTFALPKLIQHGDPVRFPADSFKIRASRHV